MHSPQRRATRAVQVGNVPVGSQHPIAVQAMLKCPPSAVQTAVDETVELAKAGCDIVRVAVPNPEAIPYLTEYVSKSCLPVVADIHFDYRLALAAVEAGFAKIRLNPGNLRDIEQIRKVITACSAKGISIRVGANSGSIKRRDGSDDRSMVEALVSDVLSYCRHIEEMGFHDIVISVKASDVATNTVVYRAVAEACDYPLHIGLTATGPKEEGKTKSAAALGALLVDGIGDTIRVSLTGSPLEEVEYAREILRATGHLFDRPIIVACPTCGRCGVSLLPIVEQVRIALADSKKMVRVAVMGCVVNGPGEAAECDIGVACGKESAVLFVKGKPVRTISACAIVPELLQLLEKLDN